MDGRGIISIIDNCPCEKIDLSFIKLGYYINDSKAITTGNETFKNVSPSVKYIRYGSGWFNPTVLNIYKTYICTSKYLEKDHYIDLAEDIPNIKDLSISDNNKIINIGENWNDFTKFPQTLRDKITAKGWKITQ